MKSPLKFIQDWLKACHQAVNDCNEHETTIRFEKMPNGIIKRTDQVCSNSGIINTYAEGFDPTVVIYQNTANFPPFAKEELELAIDDAIARGLFTREDVYAAQNKRS